MNDDKVWYVGVRGSQRGPMPLSEVISQIRAGAIPPDSFAFTKGMPDWTPISQIPALATYLHPVALPAHVGAPPMPDGRIEYVIQGDEIQCVEVTLDPTEWCYSEADALFYMDAGVTVEPMHTGAGVGFWESLNQMGSRQLMGEDGTLACYVNRSSVRQTVALTASVPGRVVAIELDDHGGHLMAKGGAFLAASMGADLSIYTHGSGWWQAEYMQYFTGTGVVFCHTSGVVVERTLTPGEVLQIASDCLVCIAGDPQNYHVDPDRDWQLTWGGLTKLRVATLRGPLRVWLQSLPPARLQRGRGAPKLNASSSGS